MILKCFNNASNTIIPSIKFKEGIEKIQLETKEKAFTQIKRDCKNIPFWLPTPDNLKDYNPDKIIDRFSYCKNLNETILLSNQLNEEHYNIFKKEYQEHEDLRLSTLEEAEQDYKDELLPDSSFIKPRCCFNHYFGLVSKRDNPKKILPIFDYELFLVHNLDTHNFITLLASRGLGKTHIIVVRYTNWRILRSNEWDNQDILLTTGLTQQNSTELLNKIENMYIQSFPNFNLDYKGTEMYIDKTRLIAFPSQNIKKMRLYDRVAAVLVDEADFFSLNDQRRLQESVFGYVIKSRPLLVFFSTPNHPTGFMMQARKAWKERQEKEK